MVYILGQVKAIMAFKAIAVCGVFLLVVFSGFNFFKHEHIATVKVLQSRPLDLQGRTANEYFQALISSSLFENSKAKNIVFQRFFNSDDSTWRYVLIKDQIADGDSVSGYRYEFITAKTPQGIEKVLHATESWRCWPGRGQQAFSVERCS